MPGPILPALLRISTLRSQAKMRCRPPRGVMVIKVWRQRAVLRDQLSERRLAVDLLDRITVEIDDPHAAGEPGRRARSWRWATSATIREFALSSVVASLKPLAVSGFLSSGLVGNTGMPWRA